MKRKAFLLNMISKLSDKLEELSDYNLDKDCIRGVASDMLWESITLLKYSIRSMQRAEKMRKHLD